VGNQDEEDSHIFGDEGGGDQATGGIGRVGANHMKIKKIEGGWM
jgi:hypothetical protein